MRFSAWALRVVVIVVLSLMVSPSHVAAQEEPKPDQLKKMYDDALVQLKAAQDRKNELATENEKLNAKVAELKKQLDESQAKIQTLQNQAAGYAEQTFYLRSHYSAWQNFLRQYPQLWERWKIFLNSDVLTAPNELPTFVDPQWPLSAQG